jgi:hypothetical protein
MIKKLLAAAATAALLAAGPLVTASPAAAATGFSFAVSGPHFSIAVSNRPAIYPYPRPYRVCKPTYKRVYYKVHGHVYSKLVKVGQSCHWVYPSPRYYPYRPY